MKRYLLIVYTLTITCRLFAGVEQTPGVTRLAFMLQSLGKFSAASEGSETYVSIMRNISVAWTIKWQKPIHAHWQFNPDITSKQIVDLAVEWGAKNLPQMIQPRKEQLAYVMCLQLDPRVDQWIWVVDFKVDAQLPSAGIAGSPLPIAITPAGEVITTFSEAKN